MATTTLGHRGPDEAPTVAWLDGLSEREGKARHAVTSPDRPSHVQPHLSLHAERNVGLLERLRRRHCVRWMLAYLALAWMALQMTDVLREIWSWPLSLQRGITLALGLGMLPAAVVAWYHGERGRQRVCFLEVGLIAALLLGGGWVVWAVCG